MVSNIKLIFLYYHHILTNLYIYINTLDNECNSLLHSDFYSSNNVCYSANYLYKHVYSSKNFNIISSIILISTSYLT